jgi:hypothetical protein
MNTKAKAIEAAERTLGPNSPAIVFGAFVRGYMAGHAAHTRWANRNMILPTREERESSLNGGTARE